MINSFKLLLFNIFRLECSKLGIAKRLLAAVTEAEHMAICIYGVGTHVYHTGIAEVFALGIAVYPSQELTAVERLLI